MKDRIRRFFGGQLPLVPSYWIGLWALPVAFFVAYERLIWFVLSDLGRYVYPIFLMLGGPVAIGISLIWSSRAVWKSSSRHQGRKTVRNLARIQALLTPFFATPLILFLYLFLREDGLGEVSADQLVERQGLVYKSDATEPYTGYSRLTDTNDVLTERRYYFSGYVNHEQKYTDGEEKGLRQSYFVKSDQMLASGHYEDGQREGNWQQFHENGQIAANETFRRGCYVGRYERYRENGRLAYRGNYADRPNCVGPEMLRLPSYPRDGVWEYFDEEGVLEKTETVHQPEEFQYLEENYDRSGALKSRGPKIEPGRLGAGRKDGSWEYFDEDGNLTKTETYLDQD